MISILLNLLRCVLWLRIWSVLENVLCEFEKNMYFANVWCCILCKWQLNPIAWWCALVQLYPYWISTYWNCQLLLEECWSLQYNSEFVSFALQFCFCLMYFDILLLGPYTLRIVMSFRKFSILSLCNSPFYPSWFSLPWGLLYLKLMYSSFLLISVSVACLFPSLYF